MKKEIYTNLIADVKTTNAATDYLTSVRTQIITKSDDKELQKRRITLDNATENYNVRIDELINSNVRNVFTNFESIRAAVKAVDEKFENGGFIAWFDLNHKEMKDEPLCTSISQVASHIKSLHDSYFVAKGIASENKKKRVSLAEKEATAKDNFFATLSDEGKKRLEELLKSGAIK